MWDCGFDGPRHDRVAGCSRTDRLGKRVHCRAGKAQQPFVHRAGIDGIALRSWKDSRPLSIIRARWAYPAGFSRGLRGCAVPRSIRLHSILWFENVKLRTTTSPFSNEMMRRLAGRSDEATRMCVSEKLSTFDSFPSCGE